MVTARSMAVLQTCRRTLQAGCSLRQVSRHLISQPDDQSPGRHADMSMRAAPVTVLPAGGESKVRFAKVRWGYGPPGEKPQVFGEDVALVVDGKLESLCAFINA